MFQNSYPIFYSWFSNPSYFWICHPLSERSWPVGVWSNVCWLKPRKMSTPRRSQEISPLCLVGKNRTEHERSFWSMDYFPWYPIMSNYMPLLSHYPGLFKDFLNVPLANPHLLWGIYWECFSFPKNDLLNKSKTIFRCLPFEPLIYIYIYTYPIIFSQHCHSYSVVNPPLNHRYYSWTFYRTIVPTKICFLSIIVPRMIEVPVTSTF